MHCTQHGALLMPQAAAPVLPLWPAAGGEQHQTQPDPCAQVPHFRALDLHDPCGASAALAFLIVTEGI
jgi:hypothetical protein